MDDTITIEDDYASRDDRAAVEKALSLLEAFGQDAHVGIGVSALARRAGMSKSTAFRLLALLERRKAVERAGTAYRLGPLLQNLGAATESPIHEAVRDLMTPFLAELYENTHETVHLGVLSGVDVVYLNKLYGHRQLRSPSRIGGRVPAYCTGIGKALLARNDLAAQTTKRSALAAWTGNTITDPITLERELFDIRATGISYDRGESLVDLVCVAAAVLGPQGHPIAALSISGERGRFDPQAYAHTLRKVCFAATQSFARRAAVSPNVGTV